MIAIVVLKPFKKKALTALINKWSYINKAGMTFNIAVTIVK
jgi:hypothetical protein